MIGPPRSYRWTIWLAAKSGRTREAWIVTAPNGTRVSFDEDGGSRVFLPDHDAEVSTADRAPSGTNVNVEFVPRR